jgi:hypothetical protein
MGERQKHIADQALAFGHDPRGQALMEEALSIRVFANAKHCLEEAMP